ncbi:MAG: Rpn family recombination-promoting nuclease/putative transposase [Clostridiales bacterium]|nr:Rpn family recombination-promoting nuclease/putative transposase [Clostridiales bacterium]
MITARLANTFLWKRYRMQKQGILDVLVELNDDTKVNIELQVSVYRQ